MELMLSENYKIRTILKDVFANCIVVDLSATMVPLPPDLLRDEADSTS